jgi:hypothetical protein
MIAILFITRSFDDLPPQKASRGVPKLKAEIEGRKKAASKMTGPPLPNVSSGGGKTN